MSAISGGFAFGEPYWQRSFDGFLCISISRAPHPESDLFSLFSVSSIIIVKIANIVFPKNACTHRGWLWFEHNSSLFSTIEREFNRSFFKRCDKTRENPKKNSSVLNFDQKSCRIM